jgi:hypothetical protein
LKEKYRYTQVYIKIIVNISKIIKALITCYQNI